MKTSVVTPAKEGCPCPGIMDSRLRGNDALRRHSGEQYFRLEHDSMVRLAAYVFYSRIDYRVAHGYSLSRRIRTQSLDKEAAHHGRQEGETKTEWDIDQGR